MVLRGQREVQCVGGNCEICENSVGEAQLTVPHVSFTEPGRALSVPKNLLCWAATDGVKEGGPGPQTGSQHTHASQGGPVQSKPLLTHSTISAHSSAI